MGSEAITPAGDFALRRCGRKVRKEAPSQAKQVARSTGPRRVVEERATQDSGCVCTAQVEPARIEQKKKERQKDNNNNNNNKGNGWWWGRGRSERVPEIGALYYYQIIPGVDGVNLGCRTRKR